LRLLRGDGPLIRVGHRGAAAVAPENTLEAFEAALDIGVDAIEFDVLDLPRGPLVVAHSDDLFEVSHGAVPGRVRDLTLTDLRLVAPALPTFDEALDFLAATDVGLHVDLKLTTRLAELVDGIERRGLAPRTVVSSFHVESLHEVARQSSAIAIGRTYPEDRYGVAKRSALRPVIRTGVVALRAALARRVPAMVRRAGARALMLQHAVVSAATVRRAHEAGAAVWAWTVDDPGELARLETAGVDAVITNDPRILVATLPA
jgi:glycerophosphoryl diester phosphodiesterase